MNINKTTGYFLLFLGLFIILLSLYYSYSIFTNRSEAPSIFNLENNFSIEREEGIEQLIQSQMLEIFSPKEISKFLNLTAWSMFSIIIIIGGSKISYLGIKLIK